MASDATPIHEARPGNVALDWTDGNAAALDAVGVREGERVLDVGGGWGAWTEYAGERGIRVTSLTIRPISLTNDR